MSDVEIRLARGSEFVDVGALTVAGYDADGYLTRDDGSFDEGYAGFLRDAQSRGDGGQLVVAVRGGTILGTVTWCPPGSPFRELATVDSQGELRTLSVSPDARGMGVGRKLVHWCIDQARSGGLTEIVLCSLPEMAPAHNLYESFGFIRRPEWDWSPMPDVQLWGFSLDLSSRLTL